MSYLAQQQQPQDDGTIGTFLDSWDKHGVWQAHGRPWPLLSRAEKCPGRASSVPNFHPSATRPSTLRVRGWSTAFCGDCLHAASVLYDVQTRNEKHPPYPPDSQGLIFLFQCLVHFCLQLRG
eukprot:3095979-Amphidinium_carterae.1